MSVKKHPKYPDHWIIIYSPFGRGKDSKTGKVENRRERIVYGPCTYEAAKAYERELIQVARGVTVRIDPTFADVFLDFCQNYRLRVSPKTFADFESSWKVHILDHFGRIRFSQVKTPLIDSFKDICLDKGIKKKTINKLLSYVSAIITWAAKPERNYSKPFMIELFSANQIQPPPKIIPTENEAQRLIDALPKDNRGALCTVMYYAGLRLGDANKLKREHVNLEAGYMIVTGKGSKQRMIPITPELRTVIEPRIQPGYFEQTGKKGKQWENKTEYLWPNLRTQEPFDDVQKLIDSTCKRLGITKRITHHTLRHSFCTHMLIQGAGLRSVQILAGHSSSQVTERYTHLIPDFLQQEMSRISIQPAEQLQAGTEYPPELQKAIEMMIAAFQAKG